MRLLIVSYLFPPAGGIAVQRVLSLARHLPANGIQVHVLAASNPSVPTMDPSLLQRVPPDTAVTRTWSPELPYALRQFAWRLAARRPRPSSGPASSPPAPHSNPLKNLVRTFLSPDPEVLWVPGALRAARRIVSRHAIDAVMVTAPPFSSCLIGNRLKREFPHLRLITDFRDEWLDFYLNAFEYFRHDRIHSSARRIERETVLASDLVLSITSACVKTIRNRYPELPAGRFFNLPNGFDPGLFDGPAPVRPPGPRLKVTHVGTVYPTANPCFYLDAVESLDAAARIETHFVGRVADELKPVVSNRRAPLVQHGFVPQQAAIAAMRDTDLLLITMTDPRFTSGKIYEYLATGRPILAISPKGGELDDVIRETGAGWVADPSDPGSIRAALLEILDRFDSGALASVSNVDEVFAYSRPKLAARFATRLKELF